MTQHKLTGKKRTREDTKPAKKSRKIIRYFEIEPTENEFEEIIQKITKRILSVFEKKERENELFDDLVFICEDLQLLADKKPNWIEKIINWCIEIIDQYEKNKKENKKSQIKDQIIER